MLFWGYEKCTQFGLQLMPHAVVSFIEFFELINKYTTCWYQSHPIGAMRLLVLKIVLA